MADYNSAYTGAQIDEAVGAVVGGTLAKKSEVPQFETITLPKGRVRGDVDGDGTWSENDKRCINQYIVGNVTLTEIEQWCADTDMNGEVNINDVVEMANYISGFPAVTPTDYYGNWTFVTGEKLWKTEIELANRPSNLQDIVLNVQGNAGWGECIRAEQDSATGKVTVYAHMPPADDVPCILLYSGDGSGTCTINQTQGPEIFVATYDTTTYAELAAASGKLIFCKYGPSTIAPLSLGGSSSSFRFGPTYRGELYVCNSNSVWSTTKWAGKELPTVTASDNNKLLQVVNGVWTKSTGVSDATASALGLTGDPTVDDALGRLAKKSEYKVGDIKVTARTDLGDGWVLCNGGAVPSGSELENALPDHTIPDTWIPITPKNKTVVDVNTDSDGNVYVVRAAVINGSDIEQEIYAFDQTGALKWVFDTSPLWASRTVNHKVYSVCVANGNIYMYATSNSATNKFSVFYAAYDGATPPSQFAEVEISVMKVASNDNTYYPASPSFLLIRASSSLFWFVQEGYHSYEGETNIKLGYASTLSGTITPAMSNLKSTSRVVVDSADNVILYTKNVIYTYVFDGATGAKKFSPTFMYACLSLNVIEHEGYTWILGDASSSASYTTCYIGIPHTGTTLKGPSTVYNANFSSFTFKYLGDVYTLGHESSGALTNINKMTDFGTSFTVEGTIATLPFVIYSSNLDQSFAQRDAAICLSAASPNSANWYTLQPKALPNITIDNAYAYIKAKEATT